MHAMLTSCALLCANSTSLICMSCLVSSVADAVSGSSILRPRVWLGGYPRAYPVDSGRGQVISI